MVSPLTKESKAPEWKVFDQEIAKEWSNKGLEKCLLALANPPEVYKTYSNGCEQILNKDNSLEFDDDKVEEIVNLLKNALQILPWDGVVASGSHLTNNSLVSHRLASIFQCSNSWRVG